MINVKKLSANMLHPQALSEKIRNISDELSEERKGIEFLENAFKDFKNIIDQIDEYKQKYDALFFEDEDSLSEECEIAYQQEQINSSGIKKECQSISDKSFEEDNKDELSRLPATNYRNPIVKIKVSRKPQKLEQSRLNISQEKVFSDKFSRKLRKAEQSEENSTKHTIQAVSCKAYVEQKKAQKAQLDLAYAQFQTINHTAYQMPQKPEQTKVAAIQEQPQIIIDTTHQVSEVAEQTKVAAIHEQPQITSNNSFIKPKQAPQTDSSIQDIAQINRNKLKAAKKLLEKYSNL